MNTTLISPKASLLGCEVQEMSSGQATNLLALLMAEKSAITSLLKAFTADSDFAGEFQAQVFIKRLDLCGKTTLTEALALWVLSLCSSPAEIVMWAYTLVQMQKKTPGSRISLETWVNSFPDGVPTERALEASWDAQKSDDGGNTLDTLDPWTN